MHAYVYKSQRKADTYVYLAQRDAFDVLPAPVRERLGALTFVLEVALVPGRRLVGKCLVVLGDPDGAMARVAASIAAGGILAAPSELRPLPLAGIPGWHAGQGEAFYTQEGYFRPLREGRVYPPPL